MLHDELERRVAAALHAPVTTGANARRRIMERVRAMPGHERPVRRRSPGGGRLLRHSIAGVALAAGVGSVGTLSSLLARAPGGGQNELAATAVIGDSVSATLRDTLRLVRLILNDTTARRVAVVGDFNAWRADGTPLVRDATTRRWSATVAMRDGEHRYAFVVDGTRWVLDPAAPHVRGADGRLQSLLHVAAISD